MKPDKWVSIEWDESCECFMVDLFFEAAPPERQYFHCALGRFETKQLMNALKKALGKKKSK